MIDISLEKNEDLYKDWEKCLAFLRNGVHNNPSYKYPEEITNFHIYSEIKNEKELLCIKSYLATQNLDKTRLIVWSDFDIKENPLIAPYKDLITLNVYSEDIASDTLLEKSSWLKEHDSKYYMRSGIVRFLVTNKFGGVWSDMDVVFLEDFKPILDQEWAYMWGGELDFANFGPCAAMMSFKKNSHLSNMCMVEILETKPLANSTVLDHMLLARVYTKNNFTVFPAVFFDTEWQMNVDYKNNVRNYDDQGLGTQMELNWFKKGPLSNQFCDGAFSWHWHNATHKNDQIEPGSKFDLLNSRTNKKLKEIGIL